MHMPKTHGIENITKYPRKALQPDCADFYPGTTRSECLGQPCHQMSTVTGAMITAVETHDPLFIDAKKPAIESAQFR
jgi:hypothetical protein